MAIRLIVKNWNIGIQSKSFEFGSIETLDPEGYFRTVSNIHDEASLLKSAFYSFTMKLLL